MHVIDSKEKMILHPITYVIGLFRDIQLTWTGLVKESYIIFMSVTKMSFYLYNADITLSIGHLL